MKQVQILYNDISPPAWLCIPNISIFNSFIQP
jgi:hypothetical protein